MQFFAIASWLVLLAACSPSSDRSVSEKPMDEISTARPTEQVPNTDPTGHWILTEFHDSMLAHRRIGAYRRLPPLWSHLLLNVDSNTVQGHGTLLEASDLALREQGDTLAQATAYCEMAFVHHPLSDRITVNWTDEKGTSNTLHYRRTSLEEMPFIDSLRPLKMDWSFRDGYYRMLLNELFVGRYASLDNGGAGFSITDQGTVLDLPEWTSFSFHSYFGTLHPFEGDMDALTFETPEEWHPYNWRFLGDTLILTEMEGDGDRYWLGKKELRFVKLER